MKNIKTRTAEDWEAIIMELPADWHHKVACTVWWDFCDKKHFTTSIWFRMMLDEYNKVEHEIDKEDLISALKKIGYKQNRINEVTRMKWWDRHSPKDASINGARGVRTGGAA